MIPFSSIFVIGDVTPDLELCDEKLPARLQEQVKYGVIKVNALVMYNNYAPV